MSSMSTSRPPSVVGDRTSSEGTGKPEKFTGAMGTLDNWILKLNIFFIMNKDKCPTDISKITTAVMYMEGRALNWVSPRLMEYLQPDKKKIRQETGNMFYSFNNFEIALRQAFEGLDKDRKAERKITQLRQQKSATAYAEEFQTLAFNLGWDDRALSSMFYAGLKTRVKNAMVTIEKPEKLADMIETAVSIDDRLYERYQETKQQARQPFRQYKRMDQGDPMEVDSNETRRDVRTCYNCGRKGHIKRNCKAKAGGTVDANEEWIEANEEITEETGVPETQGQAIQRTHEQLPWLDCNTMGCQTHDGHKRLAGYWPQKARNKDNTKIVRPEVSYLPYNTEHPLRAAMTATIENQKVPALVTDQEDNEMTTGLLDGVMKTGFCKWSFDKQKGYAEVTNVEITPPNGQKVQTSFSLIPTARMYVVLGQQYRKDMGGQGQMPKRQGNWQTEHVFAYASLFTNGEILRTPKIDQHLRELDKAMRNRTDYTESWIVQALIRAVEGNARRHGKNHRSVRIEWVHYLEDVWKGILDPTRDSSDEDSVVHGTGYKRDYAAEMLPDKNRKPLITIEQKNCKGICKCKKRFKWKLSDTGEVDYRTTGECFHCEGQHDNCSQYDETDEEYKQYMEDKWIEQMDPSQCEGPCQCLVDPEMGQDTQGIDKDEICEHHQGDHEECQTLAKYEWKKSLLNKNYPGYKSDSEESWADEVERTNTEIVSEDNEFDHCEDAYHNMDT